MAEKSDTKTEALPDLDDLLQCPVCYEIPLGQIFQCNEGHHVCGRCKARLEQCPVCRALFFGTRNYAMEELISNVRKLRAFKLGGKVTTGLPTTSEAAAPVEAAADEPEDNAQAEEETNNFASRPAYRVPQACKGLFRCMCCKTNSERLPSARLLNHLRYYHAPELIEGQSESGEYLQAWQFSTVPGRIVTAVRVADMGIFFLVIEISNDSLSAWLTMAASPWVAHEFCYTVTISGNDREAIFSDCVWSVRSCEGSLKKRGHCLVVTGLDARALTAPAHISGKLSVKRVPTDQLAQQTQPRAVLRVASRGDGAAAGAERPLARGGERALARAGERALARAGERALTRGAVSQHQLEPFLNDLQNGVERLSRAFANLGREADALVRSEMEVRARIENNARPPAPAPVPAPAPAPVPAPVSAPPPAAAPAPPPPEPAQLSRNARRRLRQRLRAALAEVSPPPAAPPAAPPAPRAASPQTFVCVSAWLAPPGPSGADPAPNSSNNTANGNSNAQNGNQPRASKKKRRHRR